jgi:HEPN domain-containing protein
VIGYPARGQYFKMAYSLDKKGVMEWSAQHQYANMRFFGATEDYKAARCCILNGLFAGFILANQAIEKLLKATIFLETGEEMKTCHNTYELKEKLKKTKDYNLDIFDNLLKKLYDHYLARYYEDDPRAHSDGSSGTSSKEMASIDELWFTLVEKLPMPDEVKYRMMFFADLFEPNPYWLDGVWLTRNNSAFDKRKTVLSRKYTDVRKHLYGQ